jgi:hypothetical protein
MFFFLGGSSLFYLGTYGYGSDITGPEERAVRLGVYDGFELMAYVVGTALRGGIHQTQAKF